MLRVSGYPSGHTLRLSWGSTVPAFAHLVLWDASGGLAEPLGQVRRVCPWSCAPGSPSQVAGSAGSQGGSGPRSPLEPCDLGKGTCSVPRACGNSPASRFSWGLRGHHRQGSWNTRPVSPCSAGVIVTVLLLVSQLEGGERQLPGGGGDGVAVQGPGGVAPGTGGEGGQGSLASRSAETLRVSWGLPLWAVGAGGGRVRRPPGGSGIWEDRLRPRGQPLPPAGGGAVPGLGPEFLGSLCHQAGPGRAAWESGCSRPR